MTDGNDRIERLFLAALDLPEGERPAFLARECAGDADLHREVASLLDADSRAGGFLEGLPPLDALAEAEDAGADPLVGTMLGTYRLLRRIGTGGMSAVYLAEREGADFTQRVAVKVLKRGMDTEDIVARFRAERRVLATLEHPNIARMLDGGVTDDGRPYLVMEHIDGLPITRACAECRLSVPERIRIFREACAAVQFAHGRLVIHRDLKPSNILVASDGPVKLLDFGIAKVLDPEDTDRGGPLTRTGARFLTPAYASPEQIRGERTTVATDVYSLGVVLQELLAADAAGGAPRPAHVPGDLDNIVAKARHAEPARRYGTVEQLSEDLRRYVQGFPVSARPDSAAYRAEKFIRRNALAVTVAAVALAAVLASAAGSWMLYLGSEAARREAQRQKTTADRVRGFLDEMLVAADPVRSQSREDVTVRQILDVSAERIDRDLAGEPLVAGSLLLTLSRAYMNLGAYGPAESTAARALEVLPTDDRDALRDRATAALQQGASLLRQGRITDCEPLVLGELVRLESAGLDTSIVAGHCALILARARSRGGDAAGAEAYARRSLDAFRRGAAPESEAMWAHSELGVALAAQDRHEAAVEEAERALAIARRELGEEHSLVGQMLNNVGVARTAAGDGEGAAAALTEAIDLYGRVLPEDHPEILVSRLNLINALVRADRADSAVAAGRDVVERVRASLGPDHPYTAHGMARLGRALEAAGDLPAAATCLEEAIRIHRATPGGSPRDVAQAEEDLARIRSAAAISRP